VGVDYKWLQLLRFYHSFLSVIVFRGILLPEFLYFCLHFKFVLLLLVYLLSVVNCLKVTFSFTAVHTLKLITIPVIVTRAGTPLLDSLLSYLTHNINAACNVPRRHYVRLILPLCFFVHEVVGSGYVVVSVRLDAFNSIVGIEPKLLKDLLVDCIIERHEFLLWKQTVRCLVFKLFEPRVGPNFFDRVTLIWINLQNFAEEMGAVC
jgi:hypothetical protein